MEDIAKNTRRESVLWGLYWMTRGFCESRWIRVLLLQHSSGRNAVYRVLLMCHHHARVRRWPCGTHVQWVSCLVVSRMSSAMKKAWKACFGQICKYAAHNTCASKCASPRAYLLQIWISCGDQQMVFYEPQTTEKNRWYEKEANSPQPRQYTRLRFR